MQTAEVPAPPQILGQPQNVVAVPGESASFFVVAADTRLLAYQWRFNGADIGAATNDALLLQNVSTNNEGEYRVVLTNPSGSVTSAPALLMIDSDADGVADSWERTFFTNLNQNATADFDSDGVSNLQEFLDGTNPTNNASALFRLTVVRDGGSVAIVPHQPTYTNGQTVTLTASGSGNEVFRAWLGDIVTRSNPVTVVMTTNRTVHARFTPIIFTWTNFAGGNWNIATNWTPNLVPGSNDHVVISGWVLLGGGGFTVTLDTPADCASVTLDGFSSKIPTLTGSGTLTVRESLVWRDGMMSGSGRTVLESGATLTLDTANGLTLNTRTLELGGTTFWTTAGTLHLNNAVITNRAGAVFHALGSGSITRSGGACQFDNAGTFRSAADSGATALGSGVSFNNYGAVEIQAGTLSLSGGGIHSGSFDVPNGTALLLSGGTHTAGLSSSITGAGQLTVTAGTVTLAGLVNISGSNTFSGGTANLTGNYICTDNTLTISGSATANFDGTGLVSPAIVNLSGGTLGGSDAVTVGTQMNWTGGTMSGSGRTIIQPAATLNKTNATTVALASRTLENGGTVLWSGAGVFAVSSGGVITNRLGALFRAEGESVNGLGGGIASGRFDNAGIFRKSVGVGTTTVSSGLAFNNSGAVEIQTGALSLLGGGTHSGSFDVPGGTALTLSGTHTANASSAIAGAGQLFVSGGTASLGGLVNVSGSNTFGGGTANLTGNYFCTNNTLTISGGTANFNGTGLVSPAVVNLTSGTLGGSNLVTVGSVMNWTGGTMSGSGRTIIQPAAILNKTNANNVTLTSRTLENAGTVLWTGAGVFVVTSSGVITNRAGALFRAENEAVNGLGGGGASGRFDNAGTFRKSAGTGTTTVANGMKFTNYNTVEIRSGKLAPNGGYVSSSNALLNCALGGATAGTGHGQLQVAGAVTLNGALSVDFINGFSPALNDAFTVLTAGTRNGTFANFFYPSNAVTMQLSNSPTSVIVRVTGIAVPEPMLFPPMLSSSNVLLCWTAVSNTSYRVEFNPDLDPSNWTALPGDVIATNHTACKQDSLTSSNRFYRVRVLP